jgi:hypothetical protein
MILWRCQAPLRDPLTLVVARSPAFCRTADSLKPPSGLAGTLGADVELPQASARA